MELTGRVRDGVVVLDGNPPLPEGAAVTVSFPVPTPRRRAAFPLVRSDRPGSVNLTGERVAEHLDDDVSAGR